MKLIIDIGNTLTKTALFDHNDIVELVTAHELSSSALKKIFEKTDGIKSSIVASVRDTDQNIIDLLAEKTQLKLLNKNTPLPFSNKYATPETLGNDRVAAAAGASAMFPRQNVLIIDAGSCITYDLITSKNEYLGGGISPGINMRFSALHTFTKKLPLINFRPGEQPALIGTDTESSILSGAQNGVLLEVDGIINAYREQFRNLKVVISGGDYKYFDKYLKNNIFASPNIVLAGLNRILDFNEES